LWLVLSSNTPVNILEDLVESELSESLSRVTDESGSPSNCESFHAVGCLDFSESISDSTVKSWVGLKKEVSKHDPFRSE